MADGPLWLREAEVAELLSLDDAMQVLADAYRLKAAHQASTMSRAHLREGQSILHAVGGSLAGLGVSGVKTWTYTPRGASPLLIVFSLEDGSVEGIVEAFGMGQLRTAATSGLATRLLARGQVDSLALLGTGRQAFAQAQAIAAVRPIRHVRLFGRDPSRRRALAARIADELAVTTSEHADVASAVDGAAIVTAVTRAADPVLFGDMLSPGVHINAVGSIVPSRRELDPSAVGRCSVVIVDSVEQAREDAGELRSAADAGLLDWSSVRALDAVVDHRAEQIRSDDEMTLFKALGVGLSDVALGAELIMRARAAGTGVPLPAIDVSHH